MSFWKIAHKTCASFCDKSTSLLLSNYYKRKSIYYSVASLPSSILSYDASVSVVQTVTECDGSFISDILSYSTLFPIAWIGPLMLMYSGYKNFRIHKIYKQNINQCK